MLRRHSLFGFAALCLTAAPAWAAGEGEPWFTNGVMNPTITSNWQFQASKRDPQLMQ